jgi:hypothetical protein
MTGPLPGSILYPFYLAARRPFCANGENILMVDRTLFLAPVPRYPAGATLVVEYEILEGRNVLARVPEIRV